MREEQSPDGKNFIKPVSTRTSCLAKKGEQDGYQLEHRTITNAGTCASVFSSFLKFAKHAEFLLNSFMKYIEMPNLRLTSAYNQYQIDKNKFNVNDTGHL